MDADAERSRGRSDLYQQLRLRTTRTMLDASSLSLATAQCAQAGSETERLDADGGSSRLPDTAPQHVVWRAWREYARLSFRTRRAAPLHFRHLDASCENTVAQPPSLPKLPVRSPSGSCVIVIGHVRPSTLHLAQSKLCSLEPRRGRHRRTEGGAECIA